MERNDGWEDTDWSDTMDDRCGEECEQMLDTWFDRVEIDTRDGPKVMWMARPTVEGATPLPVLYCPLCGRPLLR